MSKRFVAPGPRRMRRPGLLANLGVLVPLRPPTQPNPKSLILPFPSGFGWYNRLIWSIIMQEIHP